MAAIAMCDCNFTILAPGTEGIISAQKCPFNADTGNGTFGERNGITSLRALGVPRN